MATTILCPPHSEGEAHSKDHTFMQRMSNIRKQAAVR